VRKITPAGVVSTLASTPNSGGIAVDGSGNVYVSDYTYAFAGGTPSAPITVPTNATISKITSNGTVSNFAGAPGVIGFSDGPGAAASFGKPLGLTVDGAGNVYVADSSNQAVRKITPDGTVSTLAGPASVLVAPTALAADPKGDVYLAGGTALYEISPAGSVSTVAGSVTHPASVDGTGAAADFDTPSGIAVDGNLNLWVAETADNALRKVSQSGVVTTTPSIAPAGAAYGAGPGVATDARGNVYAIVNGNQIVKITPGGTITTLPGASLRQIPYALAVDAQGNVYVADIYYSNIQIVTPNGLASILAGSPTGKQGSTDGTGAAALFNEPTGLAVDGSGNVFVADTDNSTIRKITSAGVVSTVAGTPGAPATTDGSGTGASFSQPGAMAFDGAGNLYICDSALIRKMTSAGVVSTVVGVPGSFGVKLGALPGSLGGASGLSIDKDGVLYVSSANAVLKIQFQ